MFKTLAFSNPVYLSASVLLSVGVLSGCTYCEPLLLTMLVAPLVRQVAGDTQIKVVTN